MEQFELEQLLHSIEKNNYVILSGAGGVGKTTIANQVADYFLSLDWEVILLGATGKAARVLSKKTNKRTQTIHSATYSYVEDDNDLINFFSIKSNRTDKQRLIIKDETSMEGDEDFYSDGFLRFGSGQLLTDNLNSFEGENTHILSIGDPAQNAPIGASSSPALSPWYMQNKLKKEVPVFVLKKNYRQESLPNLTRLNNMLRESIFSGRFSKFPLAEISNYLGNDLEIISESKALDLYLESYSYNRDEVIFVALSNAEVSSFSAQVRTALKLSGLVDRTDRLICTENSMKYPISNGDILTVKELSSPLVKDVFIKGRSSVELQFQKAIIDLDGEEHSVNLLLNSLLSTKGAISKDERQALIIEAKMRLQGEFRVNKLTDSYLNALKVKSAFGLTCHRAQGSQAKYVFVKVPKYFKGRPENHYRWLYTAFSRASEKLFLIF